jgi:disulfide oxidoreductase YuzD
MLKQYREKEMERYLANWTTPFEPVEIYAIHGNTSSQHFETALCICKVGRKKFTNWKKVAKYLYKHQEFYGCYEDLTGKLTNSKLINMFEKIVDPENMDPVTFVYGDNPLIQWFKIVRGITN